MKVLVTGANGFVGSHILDVLLERGLPVRILLRKSCDTSFIARHLESGRRAGFSQVGFSRRENQLSQPSPSPLLTTVEGSIDDPASLNSALDGVTHVIHCAGRTKACRPEEFYKTNHQGTRNIVEAVNAHAGHIQRLLHISSLAVVGPGTPEQPAREDSPARPVSHYGKSKLAGENEVTQHCRADYAIIRPPAVYGPRDYGFLPLFKAVRNHLLPRTNSRQALSLVYVRDLAEAAAQVLLHPAATRRAYFAASPEIVTARQMSDAIASNLGAWTIPIPLPALALWPVCLAQELVSKISGRPTLLNLQKYAELRAPGWVCDPSKLRNEIGYACPTDLRHGVANTLTWYQNHHWL